MHHYSKRKISPSSPVSNYCLIAADLLYKITIDSKFSQELGIDQKPWKLLKAQTRKIEQNDTVFF